MTSTAAQAVVYILAVYIDFIISFRAPIYLHFYFFLSSSSSSNQFPLFLLNQLIPQTVKSTFRAAKSIFHTSGFFGMAQISDMKKRNLFFVFVPIFSGFVWLGMLLGMLLWWTVKENSEYLPPMREGQTIAFVPYPCPPYLLIWVT
jgi:hypothetical protein